MGAYRPHTPMNEWNRCPKGSVSTPLFQIGSHRPLDHLHCFLNDVPCIVPLDAVELLQGCKGPGIAEHAKGPGRFFSHPCIVVPEGIDQRLHGPEVPEPAQRFCRIPPGALVVIGEFFEEDFKGI